MCAHLLPREVPEETFVESRQKRSSPLFSSLGAANTYLLIGMGSRNYRGFPVEMNKKRDALLKHIPSKTSIATGFIFLIFSSKVQPPQAPHQEEGKLRVRVPQDLTG
jgi:hypothetical protein